MPSHKIHLAVAKDVNKVINKDLDCIMLGSILPDICIGKNHTISHYQNGKLGVSGVANPDLFIKNNKDKLDNDVVLGYLIHILTDKFYNTYMFNNFFIYDENGNDIGLHFKNKDKCLSPEKVKFYKQREFAIYDRWLLTHNKVDKFKNYECANKVIDLEVAKFDKERVKQYIKKANEDIDRLNIFSKIEFRKYKLVNKAILDEKYIECVEYIISYFKDKNIV